MQHIPEVVSGGFKGRKLLANDVITVKINNDFKENIGKTIHLQDNLLPENNIIHILQGPQFEAFSEEARAKIVNHPYLITEQSDRMGIVWKVTALHLLIKQISFLNRLLLAVFKYQMMVNLLFFLMINKR